MPSFLNKIKTSLTGLKGGNTLYYPGCMTKYYLTEILNNYKSLLSDLGVEFITINELGCCGAPLLNAGYAHDFEEVKEKNLRILEKRGITKIITNCPHCYNIFRQYYGIKTEHTTQIFEANKRKLATEHNGEEAAYHDPCLLARKNKIIKEPREVMKQAGFKLIEPFRNKERTFCCGAGGGLKQNSPQIADKIAKTRLRQLKSKKIIVSCPYCYAHFKENASNNKKIIELSEVFTEA